MVVGIGLSSSSSPEKMSQQSIGKYGKTWPSKTIVGDCRLIPSPHKPLSKFLNHFHQKKNTNSIKNENW
jgi:hypothetical protein